MNDASETALLVSVRDANEARAALDGGADWVDVKEPTRGPLGAADGPVVRAVADAAGHAVPISAALGEWDQALGAAEQPGFDAARIVKCGTARLGDRGPDALAELADRVQRQRLVVCAYADWHRAQGVDVQQLVDWAIAARIAGVLIDTFIKDGRRLFAWCQRDALADWIAQLHEHGMWCALAGGLRGEALRAAAGLGPSVVAVRGAACVQGQREARVCRSAVAGIRQMMPGSPTLPARAGQG